MSSPEAITVITEIHNLKQNVDNNCRNLHNKCLFEQSPKKRGVKTLKNQTT